MTEEGGGRQKGDERRPKEQDIREGRSGGSEGEQKARLR